MPFERKPLILLLLLLLYAPFSFAQGTCPANLPVSGTNCFFIAASGSDSNNGTSESTPWLHAPGMPNCTGTCASKTPSASEGFIFRGGDTWHLANPSPSSGVYTGGMWVWQWSGGSSNCNYAGGSTSTCIYIGTDPTWYTGGSFARPALDWDNPISSSLVSSCSYADLTGLDIGNSTYRNVDYVTFDDFELYGKCSQSVNPANWVFYWGNYITFSRLYVHGWTEVTGDNTSCCEDEMPILEGSNGITQPTHDIVTYDVFDGSDSYCTGVNACSGGPILYNDQYEMDHSVCRYMSNCIAGGAQDMTTFHDNLIEYVYESWDPYTHSNILEMNGTPTAGWVTSVYNNIVRHTSVGITFDLWLVHGSSGYFFNNTLFDVAGGGNCVQIENDYGTGASTFYFTNNTIDHTTSICSIRPTPNSGQGWNGTTYFQNNHMVAITSLSQVESSCPSGSSCTWTDNGNEIFQTESVANGQGYTSSNNYQPTSTSVATYHAGGNLSSSCSTYSSDSALCKGSTGGVTNTAGSGVVPSLYIASPSSRNSTWDAGAYQYQASGPTVGGATALPPNPDQIGTNLVTNPTFGSGNFTGYGSVNACASIVTSPVPSGATYAADLTGCAAGNTQVFNVTVAMADHEALLVRWKGYASSGYLGNGITIAIFDNNHGSGEALWSTSQNQQVLTSPSTEYSQQFVVFWPNLIEHGLDNSTQVRFELNGGPAWAASKAVSLGYQIVDSSGYIEQVTTAGTTGATVPSWNHSGTTSDGTATWTAEGLNPPFYITNIEVEPTWFPIRTEILYPNYRGYLWSDLIPPKRFTQIQPVSAGSPFYNFWGTGSAPVAGEIMGESFIDPPPGDSLSQLTLTETLATVSGCGSGVLATDTFASPQSIQPFQFTPSQYGSLTIGENVFVCSSLYLTSGMTLIDSYPEWSIYYENPAFRATLNNWYDPNNIWYHNGVPEILLGAYDEPSSQRGVGTPTTYAGWNTSQAGIYNGCLPQATTSPTPTNSNQTCEYSLQGFTGMLSAFNAFSGINPTGGDTSSLGYWLELMGQQLTDGIAHFQILNNWQQCAVGEEGTSCTTAPTWTPTVTPGTGGSITANYLFLEGVENAAPISQGNAPTKIPTNTLPSSPVTVNLSAAGCAGASCSVSIPMPSCSLGRNLGWDLYAATGSTSTPPANSSFMRQYVNPVGAMLGSTDIIPCGATVSLSAVNTGPPPPTSDNTYAFRPSWVTTQTDPQVWNVLYGTMNGTSYVKGMGGMYEGDEPSFYSMPWVWEMKQTMFSSGYLNLPVTGVIIQPTLTQLWCRDIFDVCGEDPYGYNAAASPDEYVTGESTTQDCTMYGLYNATSTQSKCYRSRVDIYADDFMRQTFGARPSWMVVQQFGDTNPYGGYPYAEMKAQLWKCVIGELIYGSNGIGCLTWKWGDSSGMEQTVMCYTGVSSPPACSSSAWYDSKRATNEVASLAPVLLSPVLDSNELSAATGTVDSTGGAQLSAGSIISNIQITTTGGGSTTTATQCNIQSGQTSMYTNTTNWPYGPVGFATIGWTVPSTNLVRSYIFVSNRCGSSYNITFSFPSVPAATSATLVFEGQTLPISTSGCPNSQPACVTLTVGGGVNYLDTHIIEIAPSVGTVVGGAPNVP